DQLSDRTTPANTSAWKYSSTSTLSALIIESNRAQRRLPERLHGSGETGDQRHSRGEIQQLLGKLRLRTDSMHLTVRDRQPPVGVRDLHDVRQGAHNVADADHLPRSHIDGPSRGPGCSCRGQRRGDRVIDVDKVFATPIVVVGRLLTISNRL